MLSHVWPSGRVGWALDLLSHWPKHLAVAGLVVGVVAGLRRMRIAAGIAAAVVAWNGALVLGLSGYALPEAAPADARLLRIVSANVHGSLPALLEVAELARAYDADVVAIYEVPDGLIPEQFGSLFPDLPMRALPSERPNNGWPLIRRSGLALRAGSKRSPSRRMTAAMVWSCAHQRRRRAAGDSASALARRSGAEGGSRPAAGGHAGWPRHRGAFHHRRRFQHDAVGPRLS